MQKFLAQICALANLKKGCFVVFTYIEAYVEKIEAKLVFRNIKTYIEAKLFFKSIFLYNLILKEFQISKKIPNFGVSR